VPLIHDWRVIDGKHWQIASDPVEDPAATDAREATRGQCGAGMVEVQGAMRSAPDDVIDWLQRKTCLEWIDRRFPERCALFDRQQWLALAADLPTRRLHFCIDRFEYPNRLGEFPIIGVTFHESETLCEKDGKRLCTEEEWTFACEGEETWPYPTGYLRSPDACVIDRPWQEVHDDALSRSTPEAALQEVDRLWQGEAAGSQPRCRSPFGVYDMTGNVDEWTTSTRSTGLPSILKGGYWGPVRTRCRPSTWVHGAEYFYYQQGFRCCSDAASQN
jgi:hypothetical protein